MSDRESVESDGGPRIRRLIAVIALIVLSPIIGFYVWVGTADCPPPLGCEAPAPTPTQNIAIDRSLVASVSLDADQTTAVQEFSVSTGAASVSTLSGKVDADGTGSRVRLTVLAEGQGQSGHWPSYGKGGDGLTSWTFDHGLRPGRYLAVVELLDPHGPASVSLAVHVGIVFSGPAGQVSVPPGFDLRLDASGSFAARTVSVVTASYRELLKMPSGSSDSSRNLRLSLSGAATPVSKGGSGYVIVTARPENIVPSDPESQVSANVALGQSSGFIWRFYGPTRSETSSILIPALDPTVDCTPLGLDACAVDIALREHSEGSYSVTIELVVEVRDYFLDASSIPTGAEAGLSLVGPVEISPW